MRLDVPVLLPEPLGEADAVGVADEDGELDPGVGCARARRHTLRDDDEGLPAPQAFLVADVGREETPILVPEPLGGADVVPPVEDDELGPEKLDDGVGEDGELLREGVDEDVDERVRYDDEDDAGGPGRPVLRC